MKKIYLLLFLTSYTAMSQQITPKSAFLEKWNNSKTYLLEMADAMPEEKYAFAPTEREMDFKNQLLHICGNMLWLSTTYFSDEDFDRKKLADNAPNTKNEIIEFLKKSFDEVSTRVTEVSEESLTTKVDFFAGPKSKLQILNLLQDHVTHHRGQLIVYLNLNEIKPPKYVGW
ncbi:DinB family protein [uncultured Aquimarina sp.]|uniref:DinB family protein n=1 Tax=uncultured Aquimarina sp. TaxID=575652 RepID=UPI00262654BB|nr:DinB family protein [uncultured Aquimarina sp.]